MAAHWDLISEKCFTLWLNCKYILAKMFNLLWKFQNESMKTMLINRAPNNKYFWALDICISKFSVLVTQSWTTMVPACAGRLSFHCWDKAGQTAEALLSDAGGLFTVALFSLIFPQAPTSTPACLIGTTFPRWLWLFLPWANSNWKLARNETTWLIGKVQ